MTTRTTIRSYQGALACFLDYVVDARYGWAGECEARFGTHPVQICHEWNTAVHVADYEGRPGRRPFTRAELQAFFDYADARVGMFEEVRVPAVWTVAHRGYSGNRRLDVWIYRDENTALRAAAELARSCGVDEDTLHSPNMFRASRVRVLPPMMHLIDQLGQRELLE